MFEIKKLSLKEIFALRLKNSLPAPVDHNGEPLIKHVLVKPRPENHSPSKARAESRLRNTLLATRVK